MKKKRNISKKEFSFKQYFTEMLKLPEDLVYKESLVTLLGRRQLRIENYQSLLEYQTDKIVIRVHKYKLLVIGKNLEIICYTNDEMYISGEIYSVSYEC